MAIGPAAPSVRPRGLGESLADAVRSRPVAAHLTLMGTLAFSAGVHAGLVPQHLDESPYLGVAFIGAVLATTAVAIALALEPGSTWPPRAAALLFAGQIVAYFLFTEKVTDPTGMMTKLVEGTGLVVALLMRPDAGAGGAAPRLRARVRAPRRLRAPRRACRRRGTTTTSPRPAAFTVSSPTSLPGASYDRTWIVADDVIVVDAVRGADPHRERAARVVDLPEVVVVDHEPPQRGPSGRPTRRRPWRRRP